MTRVEVVSYKPRILPGLVAVILGLAFIAMALAFAGEWEAPLVVRILMTLLGVGGLFAGSWYASQGPRLARSLERLFSEVKVKGDKLVFPRPVELRRGMLRILYKPGKPYTASFEEKGDIVRLDSLSPSDFPGDYNVVAGLDYTAIGYEGPVEWIEAPAYEVVDPEYRARGASIYVAFIAPAKSLIALSKTSLAASSGRDIAMAEISSRNGSIEAVLTYSSGGGSRSARLEIEASLKSKMSGILVLKTKLAELRKPGSIKISWSPNPREPVYLILSDKSRVRPRRILKEPVIIGRAWRQMKVRVKLILDMPKKKDVVDEAEIIV